jgi:hypothetical protein
MVASVPAQALSLKVLSAEGFFMRQSSAALLFIVLLGVVVAVLFGSRGDWNPLAGRRTTVGAPDTSGTSGVIDTEKARERGAELGEKTAEAANAARDAAVKVQESVSEAAITAKIKSKMALDDVVKARTIDVTTSGSTVTLEGFVDSPGEHDRAIALARETNGVTSVVDHLRLR